MMQRVESGQISCLVVGPVTKPESVENTFSSIRQVLPEAEIVFSTWQNESKKVTGYDLAVESKDPGPTIDLNRRPYNVKRQAVSIAAGLRVSTRPYALKLRVDTPMHSDALCTYDPLWIHGKPGLFIGKIVMPNVCLRNPLVFPQLYSICDVVHFGLREDILEMWRYCEQENELSYLHPSTYKPRFIGNFVGYSRLRCVAEQACLQTSMVMNHQLQSYFNSPNDLSYADFINYRKILCRYFEVIRYEECGVTLPKRTWSPGFVRKSFLKPHDSYYLRSGNDRLLWLFALTNKYLLSWFRPVFWSPTISHFLFRFAPNIAPRIRAIFHVVRGDKSFGTHRG